MSKSTVQYWNVLAASSRSSWETIENTNGMLEQRFGDDRSSTTGSAQAKDRCDDVNEQDDEIAYHRVIVINVCPMTRLEIPAEICDE